MQGVKGGSFRSCTLARSQLAEFGANARGTHLANTPAGTA
jgi:hypothetical protein